MPITIDPNPPTQGKPATITADANTVLYFDWDPPGEPAQATTDARGKLTITIPAGATSVIIKDGNGNDLGLTITQ